MADNCIRLSLLSLIWKEKKVDEVQLIDVIAIAIIVVSAGTEKYEERGMKLIGRGHERVI